jgi:two-component system, NtrC family, response regulator AtoC
MNRRTEEISADAMALLMSHTWPGNVRELRNILERAMVVASGRVIEAADLGLRRPPCVDGSAVMASLEDVERHHIARVLQDAHGNISQSARTLGIDRATLYNKLRKYQLRKDGEPETDENETE